MQCLGFVIRPIKNVFLDSLSKAQPLHGWVLLPLHIHTLTLPPFPLISPLPALSMRQGMTHTVVGGTW